MNKKIRLSFLVFSFAFFERSLAGILCQPEALKKSVHTIFYNRAENNFWISTNEESSEIFTVLKLVKIQNLNQIPTQARNKTPVNSFSCSINSDLLKNYQSQIFSFAAINACEEMRIQKLGFSILNKAENYGSMESGYPLTWDKLGLCTDGKNLYHCGQPTLEMQNCIKKAEDLLFSPPFGMSERFPSALKTSKSLKSNQKKTRSR